MKTKAEPLTISYQEMADELKITTRTLRNYIKNGRIPKPVKIGKTTCWPRQAFAEWLKKQSEVN